MNRHKSFIKGALTGALIMLFAVGVCTKVPELSGLLLQKDSVTAKQERAEKKTEAKFKKIEKMIDQYYLYSDDVKQEVHSMIRIRYITMRKRQKRSKRAPRENIRGSEPL